MEVPKFSVQILEKIITSEKDKTIVDKTEIILRELKNEDKVCLLRKALYGLQSPLAYKIVPGDQKFWIKAIFSRPLRVFHWKRQGHTYCRRIRRNLGGITRFIQNYQNY